MYAIRNAICKTVTLSASLLFTSAMLPALAAPLPAGTVLTIDPGVNDATSPRCYSGSCFVIAIPNLNYRADYNFVPGTDGGIVIGKNQAAGVSPATGELAGFVSVQTPTEAPGSMYTTPYTFDPTDSSANIFDDQSCASSSACAGKTVLGTWNRSGGTGLMFNMGSAASQCTSTYYCPGVTKWTITAAGAPGPDGDRYVLEYKRENPDFLDGYSQVYTFHLEGTIQLPKVDGVDTAVSLAAAPSPATQNTPLTYTATINNNGTQTATGVILSDSLPVDVNFVSATASQGSCNGTAVISCALGDLASGASASVQITVTPTVTGTLGNSVSVTSLDVDANTANNNASANVVVNAPVAMADLNVTMTGSSNSVKRLSNLTYSINVSNKGPDSAGGVVVQDTLPLGMRLVSVSSNHGTCDNAGRIVFCFLDTLANQESAGMIIVVQPRLRGTYTNTVSVSSGTKDGNTSNNKSSVKTTVK